MEYELVCTALDRLKEEAGFCCDLQDSRWLVCGNIYATAVDRYGQWPVTDEECSLLLFKVVATSAVFKEDFEAYLLNSPRLITSVKDIHSCLHEIVRQAIKKMEKAELERREKENAH